MTLVKLKMRKIYKAFLSLITFLFMLATILGVAYLSRDAIKLDSDIEVNDTLSVNYIDGKKFKVLEHENLKFSVSNSGDIPVKYVIVFKKIKGEGKYKIYDSDKVILEGELKTIDELTTSSILISANETKMFEIEFFNNSEVLLEGTLNMRKKDNQNINFANAILTNVIASENSLSSVGVDIAVEDEGLIKSSDDLGVSYYFRGNVKNNFVYFADNYWRIVRINGDGTVRLVLDNAIDMLANYYDSVEENLDFINSNLYEELRLWSQNNLNNNVDYIANSKFCSDTLVDGSGVGNAYTRIITNKIPTFNCLGSSYSSNIGLLTIDEVVMAGLVPNAANKDFYLYNDKIDDDWYTMSLAQRKGDTLNFFMIDKDGNMKFDVSGNLYRKVRPVINLVKNVYVEGNGTYEQPYTIIGKK